MLSVKELSDAEKVLMMLRKKVQYDHFLGSGNSSGREIANKSNIFVCKLYKKKELMYHFTSNLEVSSCFLKC